MFNLGFAEVVVLAVIALIFIGPKQLPELARTLGRFMNELKRTTGEIGQTIASPTNYVKDQVNQEVGELKEQWKKTKKQALGSSDDEKHDRKMTQSEKQAGADSASPEVSTEIDDDQLELQLNEETDKNPSPIASTDEQKDKKDR